MGSGGAPVGGAAVGLAAGRVDRRVASVVEGSVGTALGASVGSGTGSNVGVASDPHATSRASSTTAATGESRATRILITLFRNPSLAAYINCSTSSLPQARSVAPCKVACQANRVFVRHGDMSVNRPSSLGPLAVHHPFAVADRPVARVRLSVKRSVPWPMIWRRNSAC